MLEGRISHILGMVLSVLWVFMGFINFFASDFANVTLVVAGTLALCINIYLFLKKTD